MISYVQNLAEHFRYSRQFYYLILDLNGNYSYINPLFRETFNPRCVDSEITLPAFACSEYNKLIKATKECLRNPSSSVIVETANKSIHGDSFLIKWEISAITDEEGRPESVQAIGVNVHPGFNCKQANNTHKETEERFRRLVSDLKFGVTMRDSEGKALLCNKAMLEFSGLSEDEFLNTTPQTRNLVFFKEDGSKFPYDQHPAILATKTKSPVRDVVLGFFKRKSKERTWLLVNAEPILTADEKLMHVITTYIDITERKKLEQKLINKEIDKQRIITKATIEGQEKERKEIGKELHDNISQLLTTTKLYLEIAKETTNANTLEMIQLSSRSIAHVIDEIRKLSRSLTPPALGDLGLVESVRDLCECIKTTQVFAIRFYHKDFVEDTLPDDAKLMLFRIIQEQINNIIKYANASAILIRLITSADKIMLVVSDNGKGFDPSTIKKGLGLNNIINRAELFNGTAEIRSIPGQGCTIIVTIPRQK